MKEDTTDIVIDNVLQTEVVKTEKGKRLEAEKTAFTKPSPEVLAAKQAELIKKREDYDKRLFAIGANIEVARRLHDFIKTKAKWTYSESLGVIEVDKLLTAQLKDLESGKQKNIFLSIVALEAMHYFMKKHEGVGLKDAIDYLEMLEPIGEALQRAQKEYEALQGLEFELASLEHGIDVENTPAQENAAQ